MKGFISFLQGFIIGGAVGAAAVILFTPTGGTQLRDAIRDRITFIIAEGQRAAEAKRLEMEREFAELTGTAHHK